MTGNVRDPLVTSAKRRLRNRFSLLSEFLFEIKWDVISSRSLSGISLWGHLGVGGALVVFANRIADSLSLMGRVFWEGWGIDGCTN